MNYISCPLLNIIVSEKSARATYVAFLNELIKRIPFVCDRIYSYMDQQYLPNNSMSRHIVTLRKEILIRNINMEMIRAESSIIVELSNGWYASVNADPRTFAKTFLARIEEALGGIPIIAIFESNGQNQYDNGAHRNIGKMEYNLLTQTAK